MTHGKPSPIRKGSPPDARKLILAKAIVDPAFRKELFANPEKVFGEKRLADVDRAAVERLKSTLPALDELVGSLAGEILCGGPVGDGTVRG
jgi:hypothetical protein